MNQLTRLLARAIDMVAMLKEAPPNKIKVHFSITYIGDVWSDLTQDLIAVEIKDAHGELGWLYGDQALVVFTKGVSNPQGYAAFVLKDFKAYVEDKLKKKEFSDTHEAYKLRRIDKSIIGYIPYSEIPESLTHHL